jgi:hypothetical protein
MFPSICHFLPEAWRGGAPPPLFYLLPISPLAALLLLLLLLPMCLSSVSPLYDVQSVFAFG